MCLVAVAGREAGRWRADRTRGPNPMGRPVTRINLNFAKGDVHYASILPNRPFELVGGALSGPVPPVERDTKRPNARSGRLAARISGALKYESLSTVFMLDQSHALLNGEHREVAERRRHNHSKSRHKKILFTSRAGCELG